MIRNTPIHCLLVLFFLLHIPLQADFRVINADLGLGYRQDNLDWSIAGTNNVPNVLSELEWTDIRSREVSGVLAVAYGSIYVRGNADYGRIFSGSNRDSDYGGNDRTEEYSRSRATSDSGEVFDLSAGMGCIYECGPFTFAPLVGWSLDEQHLRDRKGIQIINTDNPDRVGPFDGLHQQYYAKWKGPWVGVDASWHPLCHWLMKGSLEYHWVDYEGRGHWNLRRSFADDFEQVANGHGVLGSLNAAYMQTDNLSWGIAAVFRKFKTEKGRDRIFLYTYEEGRPVYPIRKSDGRFNEAHWDSLSIKLYVSYAF